MLLVYYLLSFQWSVLIWKYNKIKISSIFILIEAGSWMSEEHTCVCDEWVKGSNEEQIKKW